MDARARPRVGRSWHGSARVPCAVAVEAAPVVDRSSVDGTVTLDVTAGNGPSSMVVRSCGDARTERFAAGERIKTFEPFRRRAEGRLERLDAATSLVDFAGLPGNRLEKLGGDRKGQYSIRINDQWRICFEWPDGSPGPTSVEIIDYH